MFGRKAIARPRRDWFSPRGFATANADRSISALVDLTLAGRPSVATTGLFEYAWHSGADSAASTFCQIVVPESLSEALFPVAPIIGATAGY